MDAQQLSTLLAKLPSLEDEDKKLIEEFTPGMKRISKDAKGTLRQELVGNLSTQCNLHEHDGYAGWLARLCPDRPADPGEGAGPESLNGDLVAASAAPRAIFCCFNPRADAFTCHTRGSFDAFHEARASEACVVFMPTRPRRSQLPNYLRDDLPPNALVVLVVEADMFAKNLFAPLYQRDNYHFLVLPHRRGIPFARHAALTFARKLEMRDIFFVDDDIIKLTSHDGKSPRSFSNALITLRSFGREVSERGTPAAVVGTLSARHLRTSYKSVATRSCQMDFRCVYLNVKLCDGVDFLHRNARILPRAKWDELWTVRNADGPEAEEVQKTFFQGEDFGFCEALACLDDFKPRSYAICSLYAHDVITGQSSMAGTTASDGGSPQPDRTLRNVIDAGLEGLSRVLSSAYDDEATDEEESEPETESLVGFVKHANDTNLKLHYRSVCKGMRFNEHVPNALHGSYKKCGRKGCWP